MVSSSPIRATDAPSLSPQSGQAVSAAFPGARAGRAPATAQPSNRPKMCQEEPHGPQAGFYWTVRGLCRVYEMSQCGAGRTTKRPRCDHDPARPSGAFGARSALLRARRCARIEASLGAKIRPQDVTRVTRRRGAHSGRDRVWTHGLDQASEQSSEEVSQQPETVTQRCAYRRCAGPRRGPAREPETVSGASGDGNELALHDAAMDLAGLETPCLWTSWRRSPAPGSSLDVGTMGPQHSR